MSELNLRDPLNRPYDPSISALPVRYAHLGMTKWCLYGVYVRRVVQKEEEEKPISYLSSENLLGSFSSSEAVIKSTSSVISVKLVT
jgi:hypothetical protein